MALDSSLEVTASATQVKVGQTVSFTAQFRNNGCGQVANPQYHLITSGPAWPAPLVPGNPPTLSHTAGVSYGEADAAAFALRASNPGQTTVTLSAVFQFRQDSTGASTWNVVAAQPVQITVTR